MTPHAQQHPRLTLVLTTLSAAAVAAAAGWTLASMQHAVVLILAAFAVVVLIVLPLRLFAAAALGILAVVPSILTLAVPQLSSLLGGQARAVVLVMLIAAGKLIATKSPFRMPRIGLATAGLYACLALVGAIVAQVGYHTNVATPLSRDMFYMLAMVTGIIVASAARAPTHRLSIYRSIAFAGILIYGSSVVYWLYAKSILNVGGLSPLFAGVHHVSTFQNDRSIFPFAQDSPNHGAIAFVMIGVFVLPALVASGRRRDKRLAAVVLAAMIAGVLTTQSRTGLVALGAAAVAYVILASGGHVSKRLVLGALVILAGIFFISPLLLPSDRQLSLHTGTLQSRVDIWQQAWHAFGKAPVIGHGYNYSSGDVFVERAAPGASIVSLKQSVHSELLGQLVDGGIIGFSLFVAFLGGLAAIARRAMKSVATLPDALGFACALAAACAGMIDNAVTKSAVCITLLWLFVGLTLPRIADLRSRPDEARDAARR
jgi:O-antigen ligase